MVFLRKLGSTAATEAPRWGYNREHRRRASWNGDFKSHGVAVCTPRQQQRQQQQLQQVEKQMWGKPGDEGKHVGIFREKPYGQAVCTLQGGMLGGAKSCGV